MISPLQYGHFELDEVLDGSATQQDTYDACVAQAVDQFLQVRSTN
jgi:hypothetical protein